LTPPLYCPYERLDQLPVAHRGGIPADHQVILIEIPEDVAVETLEPGSLPENWSAASPNEDTAALGSRWAAGVTAALLRVPSAIYADEANYVFNPLQPDFARIRFEVSPEDIDERLQTTEVAP
jgi:RES domain-containing protein